jgi:myo-inositol-1(or 4)-monophosphatase
MTAGDPVARLLQAALDEVLPVWRRGVQWMRDKDAEPGLEETRDDRGRPVENPRGVDLVTEGDILVDRIVREGLARLFPGVPLVSEERDPPSGIADAPADCFVLDPIDGTSNFATGLDLWAISLARVRDGVPQEAWLLEGPSRILDHGVRGGIATRAGVPMRVTTDPPHVGLLSVALSPAIVPLLLEANRFLSVRCLGSHATSLAWVSAGLLGVHVGRGHPWDVAAGYLFLECAGGRVLTLDGAERGLWCSTPAIAGAPQHVDLCLSILGA